MTAETAPMATTTNKHTHTRTLEHAKLFFILIHESEMGILVLGNDCLAFCAYSEHILAFPLVA